MGSTLPLTFPRSSGNPGGVKTRVNFCEPTDLVRRPVLRQNEMLKFGGGGGNRTRVQRTRPKEPTCLVSVLNLGREDTR
jgi:hypothetical protein